MKNVSTKQFFIGIICIFFIITASLLPLFLNIKSITYNCYNAVDFSIYQQAVYDILTLKEWNPYLTIRNINIFNDHFDPILYLAVLFTAVFGQGFQQLLIFEWLFYLGLIISICYIFISNFSKSIPYIFCILTTTLLLNSFLYPIHPSTWACLPLFWLTYFIVNNKRPAIPIFVLLTCLFKESYAFACFPLGIFYVAKKEFKIGVAIILITSLFIFNEFYLREYLLGQTKNYGDRFLESFLQDPLAFFKQSFLNLDKLSFLKKFYPFIFCFFFFLKQNINQISDAFQKIFPVLLIFTPLFFLHIQSNQMGVGLHYVSQFAGILIGLIVSLDMLHRISKKQKIFVLALFTLSSLGIYTRYFKKLLLSNYKGRCLIESDKLKGNREIRSHIAKVPSSTTILASGGIIPFIMMPNKKIYHYGGYSQKRTSYDYLILEKLLILKTNEDNWPISNKDIQNVIQNCKGLAEEIYLDNKYFFFAGGKFENCVY